MDGRTEAIAISPTLFLKSVGINIINKFYFWKVLGIMNT